MLRLLGEQNGQKRLLGIRSILRGLKANEIRAGRVKEPGFCHKVVRRAFAGKSLFH
jgi:hypothetical protein